MKQSNFDSLLFELTKVEKQGHTCKIENCKSKVKYLDKDGSYYCINHYPIRINMNKIDIIRHGVFTNPQAESLRKEIVLMDCGFTKGMIEALNQEIFNERDEIKLIECLLNTRDAMAAEIPS